MEQESGAIERPEDLEKDEKGVVRRWLLELKLADKRETDWRKKSAKILSRYRQKDAKKHSFNILWSNTETLRPAVYNSLPKPDVRRRFKDADPMGKAVSEVLSRSIEYGLDTTDFDVNIKMSVLDMLLPGRGVARVRYVPDVRLAGGMSEATETADESLEGDFEEVQWEQAPVEHVQWDDFRIGPGKEWSEIPWIGFRHRLTRDELEAQFPDCGADVQLDATEDEDVKKEDAETQNAFKTAEVWEIWAKDKREVLFISSGYKERPLKTLDDPMGLTGFWPVPRPLYAIEDASSLVPVPLYELYKQQADELDAVTARIGILIKGLKLRGIYDSTLTELSELMRGEDNDLIPAANVTALLERGGLEKAIWFMPIEQAAMVLKELYVQREQVKQVIYEIMGLGDILRGVSNPNETARAQEIKSKWGGSRITKLQSEVARFIRDIMRLQAEIIGERFQPETLEAMTGLKYPRLAEKQEAQAMYQQQAAQAQMAGQQPPPPPEILSKPSWEEIIRILRDDKLRTFKVDVETDSTVAASIEGDMEGLTKVLTGVVELVNGLGPAVQMGALPIEAVKELVLTVARRAKMGNAVEDAFDKMQPPKPQADPEQAKAQAQAQAEAQKTQIEAQKHQAEMQARQAELAQTAQIEQQRNAMEAERSRLDSEQKAQVERMKAEYASQTEQMRIQAEGEREAQRLAFDRFKAELEAETKVLVAQISAEAGAKQAEISAQTTLATKQMEGEKPEKAEPKEDGTGKALAVAIQGFTAAIGELRKPRQILRDAEGKVSGVA